MSLPDWNEYGLLPPGIHKGTLDQIYDRFVLDAPCRERREVLHGALVTHLGLVRELIPQGRAWVDGGFCTCKTEPPKDVDVLLHPGDWTALEASEPSAQTRMYGLLTLQDVLAQQPAVWLERLQPVGGALDAFLCFPGSENYWSDLWSSVKRADGHVELGVKKGFVEVSW
ncbi:DUF6932 family protein [Fodinicola acaciae]|uniref:DUF6932 family protein n=1 Tax=Fodinicola acaciae TaxID=2681555 RepID=UPI003CCD8299